MSLFRLASIVLALIAGNMPSSAQTVIERLISAQNPCGGLRTTGAFGTIGIDRLDWVRIQAANVSLDGDTVKLSFQGGLSCRTSDNAMIKGSASAHIYARAGGSLASCQLAANVDLSDFGGNFGQFLQAAKSRLEAELGSILNREAKAACERFKSAN